MFELKLKKIIGTISLLFLFSISSAYATVIYTWVDDAGVVHYSQQAPENIEATKIYSEDMEQALIGFIAPKVKPSDDSSLSEKELNAELIKKKDSKQAKSICDNAKHSLKILTTHSKLNRQDTGTGQSIAMTEEERQASISENKERISLFCNK